jgi:hypothetical protein
MPKHDEVEEAPQVEVEGDLVVDDLSDLEVLNLLDRQEDQIADYEKKHPQHRTDGPEHDAELQLQLREEELAKRVKAARKELKATPGFR